MDSVVPMLVARAERSDAETLVRRLEWDGKWETLVLASLSIHHTTHPHPPSLPHPRSATAWQPAACARSRRHTRRRRAAW